MALAERMLAAQFNTPEYPVTDHRTYAFCGDGCLMEGVSHEACSLAGTWGLGKLIVLYDSNGISIDGKIDPWFSEDVGARFTAYRWQVIGPVDGHDQRGPGQGSGRSPRGRNPSEPDHLPHPYRLWLAQGRFGLKPRRAAGRERFGRNAPALWTGMSRRSAFLRIFTPPGTRGPQVRPRRPPGTKCSLPTKRPGPSKPRNFCVGWPVTCLRIGRRSRGT